jgi:hypothetical protein
MSHLVVECTDNEEHPDGVPEPPTFVSTSQLLKTHPTPNALAFQVNVKLVFGEVVLNTNDEIDGVALIDVVLTPVLTLLTGLFTAESVHIALTL